MDKIDIKDDVFIGAFSTIRYGVTIGSNSVIAAGSVVVKDIPENSVYGGNPAKFICTTDEFAKNKLKKQAGMPEYKNGDKAAYYDKLWEMDK